MQTLKPPIVRPDRGTYSVLETVNVDTGKRTVLQEFEDIIEAPNWTRDGKYLVYNRNGRLYRYDLTTRDIKEIYTSFAIDCNNDHVLSSDGKSIAISHHTSEDGESRIYILPFSGGEPVLITPMAPSYLHGWSPDGKTLAYCAERNGQYDVYTIPVSGGRETQLTNLPGLDDGPEYSPDGKYIWFNSTRNGLMQLWRMGFDGSNPTQMTADDSNSWFGHVSPDGKRVAYITYKKGDVDPESHPPNKQVQLRLMSSSGGDFKVIAELFGGQGTINVNSWSPDNQTIAFVSYRLK
ncbi:MAG: transporter [Treponema sp.]|jgi:Tol biopolymer transport system component|nr:transporter [Treponema sp.]